MEPTHLAIYAAHLVRLVARWGISEAELLAGTGLTQDQIADHDSRIPDSAMARLTLHAIELTGEPGLGFYQGLQVKLSAHGAVGLAAMTSATVAEALRVAERFFPLRAQHLALALHVGGEGEGDEAQLEVVEVLPLGELRVFVLESMITGLVHMAKSLHAAPLVTRVEVKFAEPAHFQGFAHLWPGPVRFGRPRNLLVFPKSALEAPLQMADDFASQRAIEECERELATLGQTRTLLASVRRQMMTWPRGFPSVTELAQRRHVSSRTLKRQLAAHGTSYQKLLDELRRDRALGLLEQNDLSIEQIGAELGYADPSNFNRAFRRWMGVAPRTWRREN